MKTITLLLKLSFIASLCLCASCKDMEDDEINSTKTGLANTESSHYGAYTLACQNSKGYINYTVTGMTSGAISDADGLESLFETFIGTGSLTLSEWKTDSIRYTTKIDTLYGKVVNDSIFFLPKQMNSQQMNLSGYTYNLTSATINTKGKFKNDTLNLEYEIKDGIGNVIVSFMGKTQTSNATIDGKVYGIATKNK